MIHSLFTTISEDLNQYLSNRFSLSEDKVIIASLSDADESSNVAKNDNIIMTLTNIEHERINQRPAIGGFNPPVNLYVYIMFAAGFSENNYSEALKLLSATISFFQSKKVFNHQNTPDLHPNIDKLSFDMINLNIQELNQVWSVHGGKYLPSVVYRARVVSIEEDGLISESYNLSGVGNAVSGQ